VIGVSIILQVVLFPSGLVGAFQTWRRSRIREAQT
jgi:hypothetical protein